MFLKGGDGRVVISRQIYLGPLGDGGQENLLGTEFRHDTIHVEELLFFGTTIDTEEHFQLRIESLAVGVEVLLEGLVVAAYGRQGLTFLNNEFVVSTLLVPEGFNEFIQIRLSGKPLFFELGDDVAHTAFEHHEREERHHEVRELALFYTCGYQQIGSGPNLGLILHNITQWCRIGFRHSV